MPSAGWLQPTVLPPAVPGQPANNQAAGVSPNPVAEQPEPKKKKGFFGKVFGALKGDGSDNKKQPNQTQQPQPQQQ